MTNIQPVKINVMRHNTNSICVYLTRIQNNRVAKVISCHDYYSFACINIYDIMQINQQFNWFTAHINAYILHSKYE